MYVYGYSVGGINFLLVEVMYLGLFVLVYDVIYNWIIIEYSVVFFDSVVILSVVV